MAEADAVRRINVERLRLCRARAPCRRITNVTDADIAGQSQHVAMAKYVANQAIALALPQAVLAPGHDACRVLASVLKHG